MWAFFENMFLFEAYLSVQSDPELVTALQEVAYWKIPSLVISKLLKKDNHVESKRNNLTINSQKKVTSISAKSKLFSAIYIDIRGLSAMFW